MAAQLGVCEAKRQTQVRSEMESLHRSVDELEGAISMVMDRTSSVVIPVPTAQGEDCNRPREVEARCDLAENLHQTSVKVQRLTATLRELASRIEL